jgi:predicted TIM-barrel fold metal-dependent hydrolase
MTEKHLTLDKLKGKVIDIHAHIGVSLKSYGRLEYPYAQDLEGLYYRQLASGVDVNVVFPLGSDLFFEPTELVKGTMVPATVPLSEFPYVTENRMVMQEIFVFCPELKDRFIPFVCIDPARMVLEQIRKLEDLEKTYPIYGIKVNPVLSQSKVGELLGRGRDFLDFARQRNIPFLFHMSADPKEAYSSPEETFAIIEKHPDLRFCLAHCINFDKFLLKRMGELPNAWFDTAAIKIQVQQYHENSPRTRPTSRRFDTDYSDHKKAMRSLAEAYPDKIIWGTDSPAYSYICRRKQAEHRFVEFRLKATYEDEKEALDALPERLKWKACNENSLKFMFGTGTIDT